ncbi:MAG: sigma-70 family RNA polymerase sigma factor [Eubacterium sp.]|nr:sigma-70 family RNA polymerase sigma factor [Eubacterium sp.]
MERDKYKDVSDEQLIGRLRDGQAGVMDYLMEKYKNLVRKRANALYLIGGETEDLIQEGMIGLFKAVQDFCPGKETSFYHFAELCIMRQMYTAVEASRRKKHTPLNTYVPLDAGGEEQDVLYLEAEKQFQTLDPETLFISQENVRQLLRQANERLSRMERQVLSLYLEGMNYRQIAGQLGKTPKAVDNALQRIRGKIKG